MSAHDAFGFAMAFAMCCLGLGTLALIFIALRDALSRSA